MGSKHSGPPLKTGLANLSKNNDKDDSLINAIFKEKGEPLDEKGLIKQYIYPVSSMYYIGFENNSNKAIKMNLTLNGLYEKNYPNLDKINFTAGPRTRKIFALNLIEGFKGNGSFMFEEIE